MLPFDKTKNMCFNHSTLSRLLFVGATIWLITFTYIIWNDLHQRSRKSRVPAQYFSVFQSNPTPPSSFNPLFRHTETDALYHKVLSEFPVKSLNYTVIEVGCHRLIQSSFAATNGYKVQSFEASPFNYRKMLNKQNQSRDQRIRNNIKIHHKAVSDVSNSTLIMDAIGGTGDHVSGMRLDMAQEDKYDSRPNSRKEVKTIALDDVIKELQPYESVYMLKIDVQGHEAHVFKGLKNSLKAGKIRNILFEYWVDALDVTSNKPIGTCSGVNDILMPLVNAGFVLFDMKVVWHPNAKTDGIGVDRNSAYFRPLDFKKNCEWYVEKGRNTPNYTMGYWTDVLAVYSGEWTSSEKQ